MNLTPWSDIENSFTDALLLGNGASIAIADSLHYNSLYEAAEGEGFLTQQVSKIFDHFDTTDFELILRLVANAHTVNSYFGIKESETERTYNLIKTALIETVRHIHPEHSKISDYLTPVANFISRFDTVYSLNYDLIIYWAMMHGNSRAGGNRFKDCFSGEVFAEDYDYLRQPHGNLDAATLFFYPHGNLALVSDLYDMETKIKAGFTDLIPTIARSWTLGQTTPLFVSEGDSNSKLQAIRRNNYLNAVYRELTRTPESLVLYGWSAAAQDRHILSAIAKSKVKRVAISVYTGNADWEHQCYSIGRRIRLSLGLSSSNIVFFDSNDDAVWINDIDD